MSKNILNNNVSIDGGAGPTAFDKIQVYFDNLKKKFTGDDGKIDKVTDKEIFAYIINDIVDGNKNATAGLFSILNAAIETIREHTVSLAEEMQSLETNGTDSVANNLNILMVALINKNIINKNDLKFASSQHQNFMKIVENDKELEELSKSEESTQEQLQEKLKEIETKAYQMTVIEMGDIYDKNS